MKSVIHANRSGIHDLHRLVNDLFAQLQETLTSGTSGPTAFNVALTELADRFVHAPCGVDLEALKAFSVHTDSPFSSYRRAFRVVVVGTGETCDALVPSAEMAMELVTIRTAQQ